MSIRFSLVLAFVILSASPSFAQSLKLPTVAFIAAQAADLHSTHVALAAGAHEENPVMNTSNAGRIAVKAAGSAGVVFLSRKLAKRHPKAAVLFLVSGTVVTSAVAVHNYRIAR